MELMTLHRCKTECCCLLRCEWQQFYATKIYGQKSSNNGNFTSDAKCFYGNTTRGWGHFCKIHLQIVFLVRKKRNISPTSTGNAIKMYGFNIFY